MLHCKSIAFTFKLIILRYIYCESCGVHDEYVIYCVCVFIICQVCFTFVYRPEYIAIKISVSACITLREKPFQT